jgi:hypothetical protein
MGRWENSKGIEGDPEVKLDPWSNQAESKLVDQPEMQTTAYPTPLREFGLADALNFWTNRMQ